MNQILNSIWNTQTTFAHTCIFLIRYDHYTYIFVHVLLSFWWFWVLEGKREKIFIASYQQKSNAYGNIVKRINYANGIVSFVFNRTECGA